MKILDSIVITQFLLSSKIKFSSKNISLTKFFKICHKKTYAIEKRKKERKIIIRGKIGQK